MDRDVFELSYLSDTLELTAAPARFLKEIIRVGEYRHPRDPAQTVTITPARLRDWVSNFYAGPAKVWIPYRHSADPQDNTGWVEDLFVDDGRLYAVMRVTDEQAARLLREGTIEDVSVGVEKGFVDMAGRRYGELLRHVALTLDPHIRNQTGFVALGPRADDGAKGGANMPESKYAYVDAETGEGHYPHHRDDGGVDLDAVREALAALAEAELPEDVKEEIRRHLISHLQGPGDEVEAEAEGRGSLRLEARLATLQRRNRRLQGQLQGFRAEAERRARGAVDAEVASLTAQGKVLAAFAPQVRAILAGGDDGALTFEGRRANAADLLREIFEAMPPLVDFGERLALSRPEDLVPLSPVENSMLRSLGVSEEDYRRYGHK
jgi:hypothetical protein